MSLQEFQTGIRLSNLGGRKLLEPIPKIIQRTKEDNTILAGVSYIASKDLNGLHEQVGIQIAGNWNDMSIDTFLTGLRNMAKLPYCVIKFKYAKRGEYPNTLGYDEFVDDEYRHKDILIRSFRLEDIRIEISDLAKEYLKKKGIDLQAHLNRAIKNQRVITEQEKRAIKEYLKITHFLKYEMETFRKNFVSGYSNCYGYGKKTDILNPFKDYHEFNIKVKQLEKRLRELLKQSNGLIKDELDLSRVYISDEDMKENEDEELIEDDLENED